jgi:hypothetical protein
VIRVLTGLLLVAAILAPPVAAHGDGEARGFRSTVTSVSPDVSGLSVLVLDSDDRLRLSNRSGRTVEIEGYDGEPYLRFTSDGVFRNSRSPATYLNEERYGDVKVPKEAGAKARPVWGRVARGRTYEWHDHRIHWMSTIDPRVVRDAPDEPHRVFTWKVPGTVEGEPLVISGRLDYEPPAEGGLTWRWALPPVLLVLAGAAVWWRRRRRPA